MNDNPADYVPEIIKLQDHNGDFVYDYRMSDSDEIFSVYCSLDPFEADGQRDYSLKVLSGNCIVDKNNYNSFSVSCEKGRSAELALYMDGTEFPVDLITIRNPYYLEKLWNTILIEAEKNFEIYSPREQYLYMKKIISDYIGKLT